MNYFNQESERLKYRKLTKDDIPSWLEFFDNNDRLHFLGMDLKKGKETLAEEWIIAQINRYENQSLGGLAAVLKETDDLVGLAGIVPREINGKSEYEIAYSIKPKYWGQGFATEMATTLKKYGDENIKTNRFISIIDIDNIASANVARKNGMSVLFKSEFMGMTVDVYGGEVK